jgi:magnesium chelatase family protein
MVTRVATVAFQGLEARPVDVQVLISSGLVAFTIVGLPDKAVAESRERVRAALHAIGLALPAKRITVNLAPADLPKEGSHYDAPIALALLGAMGILPAEFLSRYLVMGELALDGSLASTAGVLPAALAAHARDLGLICPAANGPEAAWAGEDVDVLAPETLVQVVNHVRGTQMLSRPRPGMPPAAAADRPDMADVRGQEAARRALEVAAAGGHHMLMTGPPGAGKSMLAERLPGILPPMEPEEILETSMIASLAGKLASGAISTNRPFRAPHHTASMVALAGGGMRARPGEMSLAHNGVLFLDELPEFSPRALETLRQPLETGEITVARANYHVTWPARFQLIAAMNPCRCGMAGEPGHACRRGPRCAADYQARISGPLMDRFDIRITLPRVSAMDLALAAPGEDSATVAARVVAARARQQARHEALGLSGARTNAALPARALEMVARPDSEGMTLLTDAAERLQLSARGFHRILRVARTIADLAGEETIRRPHIAEALAYRGVPAGLAPAA